VIGNDVIDLALAQKQSNWKRKGFLHKIFTAKEQLRILESRNPEEMVWNLWSRKEAAYKIYNRQTQIRAFIPTQLECFDLNENDGNIYGKVICYNNVYFTKTKITSDFIETIAVINPSDFDRIKYLNPEETVLKINGIPNYFDSGNHTLKQISKSHHGRFEKLVTL
jgi:phosphopantetheinyl transferase (holo-ACP synthase)